MGSDVLLKHLLLRRDNTGGFWLVVQSLVVGCLVLRFRAFEPSVLVSLPFFNQIGINFEDTEAPAGLYQATLAAGQEHWAMTHFIFSSVCSSIMKFLLLSCQKGPLLPLQKFLLCAEVRLLVVFEHEKHVMVTTLLIV